MRCEHVVLEAGQALNLPAGLVHFAETFDGIGSVHVTIRTLLPGHTALDALYARCTQHYSSSMCAQLRQQIEADASMFAWHRLSERRTWPALPVSFTAVLPTEYGVPTLDGPALAQLIEPDRMSSLRGQLQVRAQRLT